MTFMMMQRLLVLPILLLAGGCVSAQVDYSALGDAWWQWAFALPADVHPLVQTEPGTSAFCGAGQRGSTWFLGGTFNSTSGPPFPITISRKCTIPAGRNIFIPIINAECSTLESNAPFGSTINEIKKCAEQFLADLQKALAIPANGFKASVDGADKKEDIRALISKNAFPIILPPYNIFNEGNRFSLIDTSATKVISPLSFSNFYYSGSSYAAGLWLYVDTKGWAPGAHTIAVAGSLAGAGSFGLDITYDITYG